MRTALAVASTRYTPAANVIRSWRVRLRRAIRSAATTSRADWAAQVDTSAAPPNSSPVAVATNVRLKAARTSVRSACGRRRA